jgi:hypothetical protein
VEHARRIGFRWWLVTPAALAAGNNDLQDPPFPVNALQKAFFQEKISAWKRYAEALTSAGQALHMALPETGPTINDGNGLEQTVTIVQPAI